MKPIERVGIFWTRALNQRHSDHGEAALHSSETCPTLKFGFLWWMSQQGDEAKHLKAFQQPQKTQRRPRRADHQRFSCRIVLTSWNNTAQSHLLWEQINSTIFRNSLPLSLLLKLDFKKCYSNTSISQREMAEITYPLCFMCGCLKIIADSKFTF